MVSVCWKSNVLSDYLSDLKCLKVNKRSGTYSLQKTHANYYQAMSCRTNRKFMGVLFLFTCNGAIRIYYDADYFSETLEKLKMTF